MLDRSEMHLQTLFDTFAQYMMSFKFFLPPLSSNSSHWPGCMTPETPAHALALPCDQLLQLPALP